MAGGLNDVSYGFTVAARSLPNVPFQVVRKFETEKIRNFELFAKYTYYFILMTSMNITWSGHTARVRD